MRRPHRHRLVSEQRRLVFNAAELLALLGIVLTLAIVSGVCVLAPRFQTDEQTRRCAVKVPRMQPGREVRWPVMA